MKPKINPDYCWFPLRLIKSPIHGWGVVAEQDIPRRRYVIEYTGQVLNRKQHKAILNRKMIYTYKLDDKGYWTLDGLVGGSGAERINHSCDPNLRADIQGKRVYFISRRPIKKGEELTVDYYFDWDEELTVKCFCGAKKCRGTINVPLKGSRHESKRKRAS